MFTTGFHRSRAMLDRYVRFASRFGRQLRRSPVLVICTANAQTGAPATARIECYAHRDS